MNLRDYQKSASDAVMAEWEDKPSTLVVMPTGTGKTVLFADIIRRVQPNRVMVVAHREELLMQARDKISFWAGLECAVEIADQTAPTDVWFRKQVVVSTVQTQSSGRGDVKRMHRFKPEDFGCLIIDEAHHATADSYRKLIEHYRQNPNLKVLGVTATPDRTDEEALGQVFDSVAFDYEILDAIQDGYLVPIYQHIVGVESLDFSHVRTTAGDLNGADLAEVMENEKNMQGIAGAAVQIIGDRRTIVFAASVKQAETLSEIFNRHRSGSAGWVCGQTNREERKELLDKFANGKIQIVVNVGVLTEGFDNPGVETIVMARPTKSRSLYAQMAGRSTRPLPGVIDAFDTPLERRAAIEHSAKPHCTIVDFVGNSGRHKLMTSADILGGNVSDEALERAVEKAAKADGPVDMAALIQRSEEELKAEAARLKARRDADAARRAQLVARVQYRSKVINPFDVWDIEPQTHTRGWDAGKQLTEKQGALLRKQGIDPDSMPYVQAKQVLNEMFSRWSKKLCTLKQAALLKKYGYPTNLTMKEASATIDALASNGWRRPEPVTA